MKIKKTLPILIIICMAIWFFATPFIAVKSMYTAAQTKDATKFSTYINYTSLKENLKATISTQITTELTNSHKLDASSIAAATFATSLINPIIDAMVTPENVAMLMKGESLPLKKTPQVNDSTVEPENNPTLDTKMYYEDFQTFIVKVKNKKNPDKPIGLVFKREGLLNWKLSSLRLQL